jgi:hypothetical protein
MKLISFKFKKIQIEKLSESFKNVKVNTKIDISNIEQIESPALNNESILKIKFNHKIDYDPEIAKIELGGETLLVVEEDKVKEIIDAWKNKKMSEDFRIVLFNIILRKTNIKALELEDQMGLPLHVPLPTLKKKAKKE